MLAHDPFDPLAADGLTRGSHMTRTGQIPWWSSIKRNLISVVPRRWPQPFFKMSRSIRSRSFSRRSREISAAESGAECGADAGIGCHADPASRPSLPLRQLRNIEVAQADERQSIPSYQTPARTRSGPHHAAAAWRRVRRRRHGPDQSGIRGRAAVGVNDAAF